MQSAILVEPKRIELREVAIPQPEPGGIIVRVRAALTDGTDLKAYRRGHPRMPMPTPFGHEFSGDVAAVGSEVQNFRTGDAVMTVHSAPCDRCFWCRRNQEELCESVMTTMILGAYAQYIHVPGHIARRNCFHKPDSISYPAAAFLEPLACVMHSLDVLQAPTGAFVAVIGDGGFGLLHAAALKRRGARPLLIGRRAERLAIARTLGVEQLIDARNQNALQSIFEKTEGRGADAVIECTGVAEVWEDAPNLVRRGGTVSFFGGLPATTRVSFSASRIHYDEVRLIAPFHFRPASVLQAYRVLTEGEIDPLPLISAAAPLREITGVFERLDGGEGLKFLIEP